jgi:signal transduction histidine kinase
MVPDPSAVPLAVGHSDERVLVWTLSSRDAALASAIRLRFGLDAQICSGADPLLFEVEQGAGVLLLAEDALDEPTMSGLVHRLQTQPYWSDLPVIVLTSPRDDITNARGQAKAGAGAHDLSALGNVTLLERPVRITTLLSAIQTALRARRRQYEVRNHLAARRRTEQERERLLAAEQAARAEVEAATRAKDDFLAVVSHELRTPLQAMLGWVRALRSRQLDAATTARALEAVERNTWVQAQLIEDLLDVSRIVAGKLRVELVPIRLVPVIEAAVDALQTTAEGKSLGLESVFDQPDVHVSGDAGRLQQVVWNLLANAIKFTPPGGRVQVRLSTTDAHARISVADTGLGISPEMQPHLFERFRQGDSTRTRAHGGLGLGLAIVRHLVDLHGGTVEVQSPAGDWGSAFTVTLPRIMANQAAPSPSESAAASAAPPSSHLSLSGLRVLVVEDDADTRDLLQTMLHNEGADVRVTASVEEALRLMESFHADVLVSDISMPGEDGYAFVRGVRAQEWRRGGRVPALALTAHVRPEDAEQARSAGFDAHIAKPVDPSELAREIAGLCGRGWGRPRRARSSYGPFAVRDRPLSA